MRREADAGTELLLAGGTEFDELPECVHAAAAAS
jgi:hypothetical protein